MNCANHPGRERVSFCQNCGKPLCTECTRAIGAAVFCEPCLAARLAAADTAAASTGASYNSGGGSAYAPVTSPVPGAPNPVLAAFLGLIPGVGAMYNGQYAKGIAHLIVFAVLVSLADSNGIFGLFVAGWIFYQAIEAHHTARARRDGTLLPNPFGLNDIGERFGFGKSWTAPPPTQPDGSAHIPYTAPLNTSAPFSAAPPYAPPAAGWGAPADTYTTGAPPSAPFSEPFRGLEPDPALSAARNCFPIGAIWLIALGLLFFFGSSGFFTHFPVQRLIPFFLIATGLWLFFRKMTKSGMGLANDGSPGYRIRLFRALRGAIWVILAGVLFFLDSFNILDWGRSWPLFIIVAGLMTFFGRSAYRSGASIPFSYPAPSSGPGTGPNPASEPGTPVASPAQASTSIVPFTSHDEEGR